MKTVRRLFYSDIAGAVAFVAVAFLALSFFIDFVDDLGDVGSHGYTTWAATGHSLLLLPGHFYEVAPIAVLIGTIYTLARMAQSSEYTILRTGGLGPARALSLLAGLGLLFGIVTYLVGDYLAPLAEREAGQIQAIARGGNVKLDGSGAWLKDHVSTPEGERNYKINVGAAGPRGRLRDVRIFEFDADNHLLRAISAATAQVEPDATWQLSQVAVTRWPVNPTDTRVPEERLERYAWKSRLAPGVVAAEVLPVKTMSTIDLYRYIGHLSENEQAAQRQQITFWKRALYPFACIVMVALALPFAYLHARSGGISLKVFGGILLGISFVLLNNVATHVGLLRDWTPWIAASAPSALYLLLSMAAFSWLVRFR